VPKLVIFRGDAVESEIRLTGNTVRIGRHERNDVVLDDGLNGVSRFHAEIRPEGSGYAIVDLNSRNGVWVNGRRIKERAPLSLGVPATVGAFELALEDDVSGTDFQPAAAQATAVAVRSGTSAPRQTGSGGSGTRPQQPAARTAARNPVVLWSVAAGAFVLLCVITYAIFKYSASKPVQTVATTPPATTPAPPPEPAALPTTAIPPEKTPEQVAKELNDQDLAQARDQIAAGQPAAALREHIQPVLERSPDNADALDLKHRAEEAMARPAKSAPAKETRAEPEIEGVTRRPNEPYDDYQARAKRLSSGIIEGKNALDKQEYATAVARFRAVANDQPHYMGVDGLLSDALERQRLALEEAIKTGGRAEQAGAWKTARQWYQRGLEIDPTSTAAKANQAAVYGRLTNTATMLYNEATLAVKSGDTQLALTQYQKILDLLSPGDELWEKAKRESELLKK